MARFPSLFIAVLSGTLALSSCSGQGGFGGAGGDSASKQQSNRPTGKNNNPSTNTENKTGAGDTPSDGADPSVTIDSDEQLAGTPISVSGAFLTMACEAADIPASEVADGFAMLGCGVYDQAQNLYEGDLQIECMELESTNGSKTTIASTQIKPAPEGSQYSHYVEVTRDSLVQPKAMRVTMTIAGERHENVDVTLNLSGLKPPTPATVGCDLGPNSDLTMPINTISSNLAPNDAIRLKDGVCGSWDSTQTSDVYIALDWTDNSKPAKLKLFTDWTSPSGGEATDGVIAIEIWSGTAIKGNPNAVNKDSLENKSRPLFNGEYSYDPSHLQIFDLDTMDELHRAILIKLKSCAPMTCKFHEIRLIKSSSDD